ncbi:thioesterase family protein [Maritimibacter fusiformis]|uniref:Thioesterase n=1 Tax=Maritimibacter fusiformis TaxID=2603819 RepID=A0A5D0RMR0_9RHOB|nr:thioesterase family protein [Maritimibacter fusiformis]TYB82920.1 thioesterase [Maritimibacter fusiformis]
MSEPFVSSVMEVRPDWIDYNGHMNMAYYNVLFDKAADEFYDLIGFGADYARTRGFTTYTAEFHVCYVRELHLGDKVRVQSWLLDHDEKRFHTYQEIHHVDGWLSATGEAMGLHVDMSGPKVAPMPEDIALRLADFAAKHGHPDRPERAGRSIGIARK